MSIDFHRLVKPIDINPLIFINLIDSDDWFSSIGLAGVLPRPQLWFDSFLVRLFLQIYQNVRLKGTAEKTRGFEGALSSSVV